jgi:hypothetical protein
MVSVSALASGTAPVTKSRGAGTCSAPADAPPRQECRDDGKAQCLTHFAYLAALSSAYSWPTKRSAVVPGSATLAS